MSWAVLVTWLDGEEEYLHEGMGDKTARFTTKLAAKEQRDFMMIGMSDEVESIEIVRSPNGG